jgi:hypothetical protein
MADWQERVQSLIIGFVFGFMVVKLFSVISSFRAGNLRVARGSDVDDALLVPEELGPGDELSAPLLGTDEETEADGGDELEDRADGESSTSSDSEAEDDAAAAASHPREFDATATDEPTVSGVESKDVETSKEEEVEAKKDEEIKGVTEGVGKTESKSPGDNSLKALTTDDGP